jgi:CDP-glycerol glycerophosphotransferase (TagB/SpsB family)
MTADEFTMAASTNSAALHFLFRASERAVKDKVVVLSPGSFSGNSKYIFCYLHRLMLHERGKGKNLFWLSHNAAEAAALREAGINAHHCKPNGKTMQLLIETKLVFMSTHHFARADYCVMQAAISSAVKVQMWHGIPAKHIAYELAEKRSAATDFAYYAYDCLSADYVVTESEYVTPRYLRAFPNAEPIINGSPRTDILVGSEDNFPFWKINTDAKLLDRMTAWRQSGKCVILFAPTYREGAQPRQSFLPEIERLFAEISNHQDLLLVVKDHGSSKDTGEYSKYSAATGGERVVILDKMDDLYPYLRESDVLVTDYSSAYYDFLLTNRRVIFFQPDYNEYTAHRRIYDEQVISGQSMGERVETAQGCVAAITSDEPAQFIHNRRELSRKLFVSQDGRSSERLIKRISGLSLDLAKVLGEPSLGVRARRRLWRVLRGRPVKAR